MENKKRNPAYALHFCLSNAKDYFEKLKVLHNRQNELKKQLDSGKYFTDGQDKEWMNMAVYIRAIKSALILEVYKMFDTFSGKNSVISFKSIEFFKLPAIKKEIDSLSGHAIVGDIMKTRKTWTAHMGENIDDIISTEKIVESNLLDIIKKLDEILSIYTIWFVQNQQWKELDPNDMSGNSLQKLNNYFDKYIDKMIIKDIELLKEKNQELKFSYPYILLVSSCIDTFGAIEKGFRRADGRGNSEERFTWFIQEWMGKINSLYREESLAYLIYDSWRCGVSHQATLKMGFETSSYIYDKEKHLNYIEDKDRIFIHSIQFADDFIKAQKLYRETFNNDLTDISHIDFLYNHLQEMMGESNSRKNQCLADFINILKNRGLIFNSKDTAVLATAITTHTSSQFSSTSSSQETITRLPDEDELSAVPSKAPDEEDLE